MESKKRTLGLLRILSIAPSLLMLAACSGGGSAADAITEPTGLSAQSKSQVGVFLETDLANPSAKRVIVSVNSVSLLTSAGASISGLSFNKDIELTLNEVALPNISLNDGQSIQSKEIRLILNETGNKYIRSDGTVCILKTPSGQQSGLKIKLPEAFTILPGLHYSVHLAFNVEKSIVEQGNDGCLLKPVIKAEIIAYRPVDPVNDDNSTDTPTDTDTDTGGTTTPPPSDTTVDTGTTPAPTDNTTEDPANTPGEDVAPVYDVVYQPEPHQIVDTTTIEVSN